MMQTPEQILEAKKALAAQRRAHSRFFSDHAYEKALEPKEMYVVEDAEHIDLYDRTDRIPFDKIEDFLNANLIQ